MLAIRGFQDGLMGDSWAKEVVESWGGAVDHKCR